MLAKLLPIGAAERRVSRIDETLSRMKNGAAGGGSTGLILPVRVRTRTEDVGRTSEVVPPPGSVFWREAIRYTPSGYSGAWRHHLETTANHQTDEVPAVSASRRSNGGL